MNLKKLASTYTVSAVGILLANSIAAASAQVPDLQKIRRVCVDTIAGDPALVAPAREIAIASVFSLKRFQVTENCAKADAVLKGAVIERHDKRVRGEGEAADFGVAGGGVSGSRSSVSAGFGAIVGGSGEALYSAETATRASVTLRLVNADGDVLWAHTQDSSGGKTKGAIADAVDRAIRQLSRDLARPASSPGL